MRPCHVCNNPDTKGGSVLTQDGNSNRFCKNCTANLQGEIENLAFRLLSGEEIEE